MDRVLKFYIYFFIAFNISVEGNLIPAIVKSKLQRNNESGSYTTDSKLWMNFLEKRLEAMNHMNSYLEFYMNNFGQRLFKELPANCEKMISTQTGGVQVGIYGKICGSSKGGKEEESFARNYCSQLKLGQKWCYRIALRSMSVVSEANKNDFILAFLPPANEVVGK